MFHPRPVLFVLTIVIVLLLAASAPRAVLASDEPGWPDPTARGAADAQPEEPARLLAAPPDLVAPVAGKVRVRIKRGSADGIHRLELRLDRAANGPGWDEVHSLGTLSGTLSNIETDVDIDMGDKLDVGVSVNFHGFVATIWYDTDRVARPGEPSPRVIEPTVDASGKRWCGTPGNEVDITDLFDTATTLMSLSCWEDFTDWDYNDFSMAVDYVPTETPSLCVCRITRNRVPASAIQKALDAPERIWGWNELLNPNVPGSPPYPEPGYDDLPNPRRTCLDLWNRRRPWHPHLNSVIWRAMCTS